MTRTFDYSALSRAGGLGARLRALAGSPMLLVGATVVVLLVLATGAGLVGVLVLDPDPDGGMLAFLGLFFVAGLVAFVDVLRKTGGSAGLEAFAAANGLALTRSLTVRHYGAHAFRSGSRIVRESVRTREPRFVEVGDAWPMGPLRLSTSAATGVSASDQRSSEAFVRVKLSGPVRRQVVHDGRGEPLTQDDPAEPFLTPAMDRDLRDFAGPYVLEATGTELTLIGARPLHPDRRERLQRAFVLADALASRAEALLVDPATAPAAASWSAETSPPGGRPTSGPRTRRPLAVIGATVALLVVVPVAFAVVMSMIDGQLQGNRPLALLVVGAAVVALTRIAWLVVRHLTTPRR